MRFTCMESLCAIYHLNPQARMAGHDIINQRMLNPQL